ncbi:hypothetical protein AB1Y20_016103 [Prymnesium parvum]|uniref:Pseudouridine synthase RsuA/RluA-like domain-containing protein n=1 Tax=Prymnesium parvum TaxID=97485 RepID=A0AB34K246_PRYPA
MRASLLAAASATAAAAALLLFLAARRRRPRVYVALYKPRLTLCAWHDARTGGGASRASLGGLPLRLPPALHVVGRLDRGSEGLLLCTDDGRFTRDVLQGGVPKRYWAEVRGKPSEETLAKMARGGLRMRNGNGVRMSLPAEVRVLEWELVAKAGLPDPPRGDGVERTTWLEVTLCQGLNQQVRRMTKHAGHATVRLVRVAVGDLSLMTLGLRPGEWTYVRREDVLRSERPASAA